MADAKEENLESAPAVSNDELPVASPVESPIASEVGSNPVEPLAASDIEQPADDSQNLSNQSAPPESDAVQSIEPRKERLSADQPVNKNNSADQSYSDIPWNIGISDGAPTPSATTTSADLPAMSVAISLLQKARKKIQFRKRRKLERILELVRQKGRIKNDDVEKLLHVSDATATNYLAALVKEGRLKREGRTSDSFYLPL